MKISEIISLPVISIFSGKLIGTIENVLFNIKDKKTIYLIIFDEGNDLTYVLNSKNIYKLGKDCLFIKNESKIDLFESKELELINYYNPISSKIYTLDCEYKGIITDIETNNNFLITNYLSNNEELKIGNILNFSNSTTILSNNQINLRNFKNKKINQTNQLLEQKVSIENKKQDSSPKKLITNYSFLINRKVTKDIINQNGEILIKNGTVITPSLINKVRALGKLIELTHFSN